MFCLRLLDFTRKLPGMKLLLLVLALSVQVLTSPKTLLGAQFSFSGGVNYNTLGGVSQGSSPTGGITANPKVFTQNVTTSYQSDRFYSMTYSGKIDLNRADYSNYLIMDQAGAITPMVDKGEITDEVFLDNTLEYTKGDSTAAIGLFGHVINSPLARYGGRASYSHQFYNGTTLFGAEGIYFEQKVPKSYFRIGFQAPEAGPLRIYANRIKLFWEQVLSSENKVRLSVFRGQRIKERPQHYGGELQFLQAIRDTLFLQFNLHHSYEDEGSKLINERGYFNLTKASAQITVEPVFDFLLSLSYGVGIEREEDPRTKNKIQVGTDHYGLRAQYALENYQVFLQANYALSNTQDETYQASGGLTWEI